MVHSFAQKLWSCSFLVCVVKVQFANGAWQTSSVRLMPTCNAHPGRALSRVFSRDEARSGIDDVEGMWSVSSGLKRCSCQILFADFVLPLSMRS